MSVIMTKSTHSNGPVIAVDWSFGPDEFGNQMFSPDYRARTRNAQVWCLLQEFQTFMASVGVKLVTIDQADFQSDDVRYVIYFDYSVYRWRHDPFLKKIPCEKRVLLILEPSNINPTLHFNPLLRSCFSHILTYNTKLVKRCGYTKLNYFVLGNMLQYRTPPFPAVPFEKKKMLIAINSNRWAYMPSSTYSIRKTYFRFLEQHYPEQFDLYGHGWNKPSVFYERWLGFPHFSSYKESIPEDIVSKIELLSRYRFHLCIENNINEPGYISEKMTDCFCARCVPLYMGWKETPRYIPEACFINLRNFTSMPALFSFISSMDAQRYQTYMDAIERFIQSPRADYFTNVNAFRTIFKTLFPDAPCAAPLGFEPLSKLLGNAR